jgi:hypothetical protein
VENLFTGRRINVLLPTVDSFHALTIGTQQTLTMPDNYDDQGDFKKGRSHDEK